MSKVVDERVVSIQFDNKRFEENAKTTMSTIEKLKQKLNFKGASKGLEDIKSKGNSINFDGLNKAIDIINSRFSNLGVVADQTLRNMVNSAELYAKRLVHAFTIEPVHSGFSEYELKMGSVQTIMASTGASLQEVNKYLQELNEYSDQTIYSFSDMTANIGKFTNAGVSLEDAVTAIKGVSNVAAISGANANEASRSMYNFAQALSSGYVKLMDWKSIELANMATVDFKNQLIESAVAAGTLTKTTDGMYMTLSGNTLNATKNFNETLQDQWMTTEVLVNTLKKYTDTTTDIGKRATAAATEVKTFSMLMDTLKEAAGSGWAQTWEIIVGDFEQAKKLFTKLSDIFGKAIGSTADRRNSFLKEVLSDEGISSWDKLADEVTKTGVSIEDFKDALVKTANDYGKNVDDMISKTGSFEASLSQGWLTTDVIITTLKNFSGEMKNASGATEDLTSKFNENLKVANEIINEGIWGNGVERIEKLTAAGYDYATIQELVNRLVAGETIEMEKLSDTQLKNIGYTEEQIDAIRKLGEEAEKTGTPLNELINDMTYKQSGRTLLFDSIVNILEYVGKVLGTIRDTWDKVFGPLFTPEKFKRIIENFHSFTEGLDDTEETLNKISRTMEGFFRVIELGVIMSSGIGGVLIKIFKIAKNVLQLDFLGLTARLGDMIVAFRNWIFSENAFAKSLVKYGNKIVDFVEKALIAFRDLIVNFMSLPEVQKFISDFGNTIKTTAINIGEWLMDLFGIFGKLIDNIRKLDKIDLQSLKVVFKIFWKQIEEHFGSLGTVFSSLTKTLSNFKDMVVKYLGAAGDGVGSFLGKIGDLFDNLRDKIDIGFAELLTILLGSGFIVFLMKLGELFISLAKLFTSFKKGVDDMFGSISSMFKSFGKAAELKAKSEAIKNFAIAIAILAASMYVLAQLSWGEIGKATLIIAAMAGVLLALAFAADKLGKVDFKNFSLGKGAVAILAIASSLLILAAALKVLDTLDPDRMFDNVVTILLIMGGLVGAIVLLNRFAKGFSTDVWSLMAFSVSVLVLVKALEKLSKFDLSNMQDSIIILAGLIGALAIISKACSGISWSTGVGVLAMVISLRVLIGVLDSITKLDPKAIADSLGVIILIMGLFAGLMIASKYAGDNALKAGIGILAMSFALINIIMAMKLLATMSVGELTKGLIVVSTLMLVFGAVVYLTKEVGQDVIKAGAMILLMSASILILSFAITIISHLDPAGLTQAIIAIGLLFAFFAGVVAVTKYAQECKSTIIAIGIVISILAISLAALSMIDSDSLMKATGALSMVMGMFALMTFVTKYLNTEGKQWLKCIANLALLTIVVGLLVGVIFLISKLPNVDNVVDKVLGISILLIAMAASLKILSTIKTVQTSAMIALAALTLIVAALALVITLVQDVDPSKAIGNALAISVLLIAITAACLLLQFVGPNVGPGLAAATVLTLLVAVLGAVILMLKDVDPNNAIGNAKALSILLLALSAACVILQAAFFMSVQAVLGAVAMTAIVGLLAEIIKGMDGYDPAHAIMISKALSILLTSLSENLAIISIIGLMGPAIMSGLSGLALFVGEMAIILAALGALTKIDGLQELLADGADMLASIGESIGRFVGAIAGGAVAEFSSSLPEIGKNLSKFMKEIQPFIDGLKGMDSDAAEGAKALAETIFMLSAYEFVDNINYFMSGLTGIDSIEKLGEDLTSFGAAMKAFYDSCDGIDPKKANNLAAAAKGLAEFAEAVPNLGGLVSAFTGDNSLVTFGTEIEEFAKSLSSFYSTISDANINTKTLNGVVESAKGLTEVADAIPSDLGVNNLYMFGNNLQPLGEGLVTFSILCTMMNTSAMKTALEVLPELSETISGMAGVETGGVNSFVTALNTLGKANVQGFVDAFSSAGPEMVSVGADMVESIQSGIRQKSSSLNLTMTSLIGSAIVALETKVADMAGQGEDIVDGLISGFNRKKIEARELLSRLMKDLARIVINYGPQFKDGGKKLMEQLIAGIKSQRTNVQGAVRSTISGATGVLNSQYNSFYNSGANLAIGFANGISANSFRAIAQATAMATSAALAAKAALDEHSPSRVGYEIGDFFGIGFINGIADNIGNSYDTSYNMAEYAKKGLSKAVSSIKTLIENGIDSQPTIRPVLDLSDISNGAGAISSMLNMNPSVGVLTNIGAVNKLANGRVNLDNSDVVTAINKLRSSLSNVGNTSYTINGVTYDDGTNVSNAVETLVRAAKIERRV